MQAERVALALEQNGGMSGTEGGDGMNADSGALRAAKAKLVSVARSAAAIDIRVFEGLTAEQIREALEPLTIDHLKRAQTLARRVFELCDRWDQATSPSVQVDQIHNREFELEIDRLASQSTTDQSLLDNVADLAFVAKCEFRDRLARIDILTGEKSGWYLLGEYDSALRATRKSLEAIEHALCKAENLPASLDFETELEVSLRTRTAYNRLRLYLQNLTPPEEDTIYAVLRAAGTHIAVLVGRDIYPELRVRDRAELWNLQRRILDWMRTDRETPRNGLRIWQDLLGVVGLFCQVSRRQELVAHDSDVIRRVHTELEESVGLPLSDGADALLASVRGLDPEVDENLENERRRNPELWRPAVQRLCVHFGIIAPPEGAANFMDDDFF